MIYTLKEELIIIGLLIVYGIYISMYFELVFLLKKQIKRKTLKVLSELFLYAVQIYVTYKFTYSIMDGYIPIYFMLFIGAGIFIYMIYHSSSKQVLLYFSKTIIYVLTNSVKEIIKFIYPNYMNEIAMTLIKRKKAKRNKDIETQKG